MSKKIKNEPIRLLEKFESCSGSLNTRDIQPGMIISGWFMLSGASHSSKKDDEWVVLKVIKQEESFDVEIYLDVPRVKMSLYIRKVPRMSMGLHQSLHSIEFNSNSFFE